MYCISSISALIPYALILSSCVLNDNDNNMKVLLSMGSSLQSRFLPVFEIIITITYKIHPKLSNVTRILIIYPFILIIISKPIYDTRCSHDTIRLLQNRSLLIFCPILVHRHCRPNSYTSLRHRLAMNTENVAVLVSS